MLKEVQTEQELPERSTLRECRQFINDLFVSNSGEGMKFVERILYKLEPKTSNFEIQRHFFVLSAKGEQVLPYDKTRGTVLL